MILIRSPNGWSCLASSFAMVLGVTLDDLVQMVGHDGSEVVWPRLREPYRRRGFHPQEMVYAAHVLGFAVTPFEALPTCVGECGAEPFVIPVPECRIRSVMDGAVGVLTGRNDRGTPHALAWDGLTTYDPAGRESDFYAEVFWRVVKSNQA